MITVKPMGSSSSHKAPDGQQFSTRACRNQTSGQVVEPKNLLQKGGSLMRVNVIDDWEGVLADLGADGNVKPECSVTRGKECTVYGLGLHDSSVVYRQACLFVRWLVIAGI